MQQGPKLWKFIVIPLGIGVVLFAIFGGVAYYLMNGSKTSRYNQAVNMYTAGNYQEAAKQFEKLGDYRDSKKRVAEAETLMHYTNAKLAFQAGDYEKAKEEYIEAGDYENSKVLAQECDRAAHYAKGESLASSGDTDKAIEEFRKSGYKDFKDKICELYIAKSDKAISDGNYDQAIEFARNASDNKDSEEPVKSCFYKMGEDAFAKKDLKNAASFFVSAEDYKDAPDKAKSIYYTLGTEALGQKDYENAATYLKLADGFKDTATVGKEAFYITGTKRYNEKKYAEASEFFKLAGSYKDAKTLYQASTYANGILLLQAKNYAEAAELFESCGSYKFSKDLVNVCIAEAAMANNKISQAMAAYKKVSAKTKISGFDVQGRKAFASRWYALDKISGEHSPYYNNIYATKKYPGLIRKFFFRDIIPGQGISIRYSVNTDGTFNITGIVSWARLIRFSDVPASSNDVAKVYDSNIQYAHVKKFPTSIKLSGGAKLTYKNGKFTVKFSKKSGKIKYYSSISYR